MAVTSFHKPTGKYLTSFGKDAKPGDMPTISVWSKSKLHRYGWAKPNDGKGEPKMCEFTTYLLGEPVAISEWGEPLFELDACARACAIDYDGQPTAERVMELHALPTPDASNFASYA
ncbi:hypothetical protein N8A98_06625 [Devosia neptuniae]|uniref:Uncharacterized protein n=1 Tax=Devosia neptuniae TaxID=191302 RepID=A0ABY6CFB4_9HYPH|nr:hypothetical protein [Devosia neptuniae]UXN70855.1 hypothetical protein N8A98_06625 [Devosia neptuniae]